MLFIARGGSGGFLVVCEVLLESVEVFEVFKGGKLG